MKDQLDILRAHGGDDSQFGTLGDALRGVGRAADSVYDAATDNPATRLVDKAGKAIGVSTITDPVKRLAQDFGGTTVGEFLSRAWSVSASNSPLLTALGPFGMAISTAIFAAPGLIQGDSFSKAYVDQSVWALNTGAKILGAQGGMDTAAINTEMKAVADQLAPAIQNLNQMSDSLHIDVRNMTMDQLRTFSNTTRDDIALQAKAALTKLPADLDAVAKLIGNPDYDPRTGRLYTTAQKAEKRLREFAANIIKPLNVQEQQRGLALLGLYKGNVSGNPTAELTEAIKGFQRGQGDKNPSGVMDTKTDRTLQNVLQIKGGIDRVTANRAAEDAIRRVIANQAAERAIQAALLAKQNDAFLEASKGMPSSETGGSYPASQLTARPYAAAPAADPATTSPVPYVAGGGAAALGLALAAGLAAPVALPLAAVGGVLGFFFHKRK